MWPAIGILDAGFFLNAVTFDGATVLSRASGVGFTGAADSANFSFAVSVMFTGAAADQHVISGNRSSSTGDAGFVIGRNASNQIYMYAKNAAGTIIMNVNSAAISTGAWHTVLGSGNGTTVQLYIDDVLNLPTSTPYTNAAIEFTGTEAAVGGFAANLTANRFVGSMSELWFAMGVRIDFSVQANRQLFFDATNRPVFKGGSGELPTGSVPTAYFSGSTTNWQTNLGSGGGMTVSAGALTTASSMPGTVAPSIISKQTVIVGTTANTATWSGTFTAVISGHTYVAIVSWRRTSGVAISMNVQLGGIQLTQMANSSPAQNNVGIWMGRVAATASGDQAFSFGTTTNGDACVAEVYDIGGAGSFGTAAVATLAAATSFTTTITTTAASSLILGGIAVLGGDVASFTPDATAPTVEQLDANSGGTSTTSDVRLFNGSIVATAATGYTWGASWPTSRAFAHTEVEILAAA